MNKIVCWGDLHGRNCWKDIVAQNSNADLYISIGDYLDTHENITGEQQLENFKDILQFKRDNKEKVILLIGNHDFHYMSFVMEHYSGFQSGMQYIFKTTLEEALKEDLLQMCHIQDKYLFSHAGVSKTWLNSTMSIGLKENVDEHINDVFLHQPTKYFTFKGVNPYGDDITQSPIWIRPQSLFEDGLKEFIHIVGHTTQNSIKPPKGDSNMWFIDTLGTSGEYLVIENNEINIRK